MQPVPSSHGADVQQTLPHTLLGLALITNVASVGKFAMYSIYKKLNWPITIQEQTLALPHTAHLDAAEAVTCTVV